MKAQETKTNSTVTEGRRPLGSVGPRRLLAMRGHSQVLRGSWEEAEKKANNLRESNKHSAAPGFALQPGTMREALTRFLDNKAQEGHGKAWNQMLRRELTNFANWCAVKLVTPENVNVVTLAESRRGRGHQARVYAGRRGCRSSRNTAVIVITDATELRGEDVEDQGTQITD